MWRIKDSAHITYGPEGKNNMSTQIIVPFSPCYCHIAGSTVDMRRTTSLRNTTQKTDCHFLACIYLKNGEIMWHQVRISHVVNLNGKLLVWVDSILWKKIIKNSERSETFPNRLMHWLQLSRNSETYVWRQSQNRPRHGGKPPLNKSPREVKPTSKAVLNALQSDK